jgi:hypothetical protein
MNYAYLLACVIFSFLTAMAVFDKDQINKIVHLLWAIIILLVFIVGEIARQGGL